MEWKSQFSLHWQIYGPEHNNVCKSYFAALFAFCQNPAKKLVCQTKSLSGRPSKIQRRFFLKKISIWIFDWKLPFFVIPSIQFCLKTCLAFYFEGRSKEKLGIPLCVGNWVKPPLHVFLPPSKHLYLPFFFLMPLPSAPRKSSSSTLLSTFAFPFVSDEIDEGLCCTKFSSA